ncbi:hypothetical protein, partial [Fusobacterium sp. PH5-44]|uniref:hypothetical protein n=2 Tax=unclassified Fusobacterium TaxID=2648384 RepID=UPI003D22A9CE
IGERVLKSKTLKNMVMGKFVANNKVVKDVFAGVVKFGHEHMENSTAVSIIRNIVDAYAPGFLFGEGQEKQKYVEIGDKEQTNNFDASLLLTKELFELLKLWEIVSDKKDVIFNGLYDYRIFFGGMLEVAKKKVDEVFKEIENFILKVYSAIITKQMIKDMLTFMQELLYNTPVTHLRKDLFGFGVTILEKGNDVVICFKNTDDENIVEILKEGYFLYLFPHISIIDKYIFPKNSTLIKHDAKTNITVTGFNVGGEIANILSLYDDKYLSRPFFTQYISSFNDLISFNVTDISIFLNQKYRTLFQTIGDAILSLGKDIVIVLGISKPTSFAIKKVISVGGKKIFLRIVTKEIYRNFARLLVKGLGGVSLKALLIYGGIAGAIGVIGSEIENNKLEDIYVLLCYMGFFDCNKCGGKYTRLSCKYTTNNKKIKYPKLNSYKTILDKLDEQMSLENVEKGLKIKKEDYLKMIFEIASITGEVITGKTNMELFLVSSPGIYAINKVTTSVMSKLTGKVRKNAIEEKLEKNVKKYFSNENAEGYYTNEYECKEEDIDSYEVPKDLEFEKLLEKLTSYVEHKDFYDVTYKKIKVFRFLIIKQESGNTVLKEIYYKYKITVHDHISNFLSKIEDYYVDKTIYIEPTSELVDSFLWYIKNHLVMYENYKRYVENKEKEYKVFFTNYRNKKIRIAHSKSPVVTMSDKSERISEFIFFPYVSKTSGNIEHRNNEVTYLSLTEDFIGSMFRSVLEDRALGTPSKDPKYYTPLEIENKKIVEETKKREEYLKIDLTEKTGDIVVRREYSESEILNALRMYVLNKRFITYNLKAYYNYSAFMDRVLEDKNGEILKKYYNLEEVKGEGDVKLALTVGLMNGSEPDDGRIAYLYNPSDFIKRGIIKINVFATDMTGSNVDDATKTIAITGDLLYCDQCDGQSQFVAKYAIGFEVISKVEGSEEGEVLASGDIGSTTDKRGGEEGSILPFDGICKITQKKCTKPGTDGSSWSDLSDIEVGDGNVLTWASSIKCKIEGETREGNITFIEGRKNGSKTN